MSHRSETLTLVSIVTPSLNQARFLGETVDTVLEQSYEPIEYLVVDGGSTDGSLDVMRRYGERLRWISEPDLGQADAIAKGFARCRGEILGWLNSDDRLEPNAVAEVVKAFAAHPEAGMVYGRGTLIDVAGRKTGPCWWVEPYDPWRLFHANNFILQPAAFFRRSTYEAVGGIDTDLHYAMDWDLWIRLARQSDVRFLDADLARMRIWPGSKTSTGRLRRLRELARVARRHAGHSLTPAVQRFALDTLGAYARDLLPATLARAALRAGKAVDRRIERRAARRGQPTTRNETGRGSSGA